MRIWRFKYSQDGYGFKKITLFIGESKQSCGVIVMSPDEAEEFKDLFDDALMEDGVVIHKEIKSVASETIGEEV